MASCSSASVGPFFRKFFSSSSAAFSIAEVCLGYAGPDRLGRKGEIELAADFVGVVIGGSAGGSLVFVDKALVESRRFAAAQHLRGKVKLRFFRRAILRNVPYAVNARLRHAVLHPAAVRAGALGDPRFLLGDGRAGGNVAVIFLNFLPRNFRRDVAGDHQHGVVRAVVGLEPVVHVVYGGGIKVCHLADHGPGIRMARRIRVLGDQLFASRRKAGFRPGAFRSAPRRAAGRASSGRARGSRWPMRSLSANSA